jgi:chemosensory pili system protein ChpA (sensor histidine kinase/response regulator)
MDAFVTTQGIAAGRRHAFLGGVATTALDPLELDQYNELHTHAQVLTETVADLQLLSGRLAEALTAIDATVHRQALLNNELHESLMTARMVPAGNLEARLQRAVRQAAEQCAKHVALRVEGTDVMLDDQMVNVLIDPLQHLLRNAVDHGLEPTAIRAQLGKSATGQIVLGFSRDGNYLMIACRDDGAGLNLTRIHAHAIERGLIAADQTLSDDEIARLILRPGFSTAHTVTEISGRGVGMDIVHTSVAKLKGSIDIRTQTGRGATFALRVPMSLGIVHCLLANAGGQTFALPTDGLAQIVYDGARHLVSHRNGGWLYSDGALNCPAYSLSRLTGLAPQDAIGQGHSRHVVLMNDVAGQIAVVVDGVDSGVDLLIKKMGRFLKNVKGVIGASILGNGTVVLILEVSELLRIERGEATPAAPTEAPVSEQTRRPDILVVDDSLSVRTALTALLAEEGFHVRTAKDGIEAIEAIGERVPALVLVDMEMPRMNGLELTAHIRADTAIRHLPIIMVTSRTAEKHRKLASAAGVDDYLTKPYRENELLKRLRTVLSLTKAA